MSAELKKFFNDYVPLPDSELEDIVSKFKKKKIKKNEFVLMQGEICKDLIFVQQGCLRLYYLQDDIEVSVWFALKHSSAIEIFSFISETPTNNYLQAIEEKRYLDLLNKPELLQTIPQKYLASFIGVTPTSLSRIKKNIIK